MTAQLQPQTPTPVHPHVQRAWARLLQRLGHLTDAGQERRRSRSFSLVVDGLVDDAWPYADALADATEDGGLAVRTWWRTHGTGSLELRCELWGSGSHVHVTRTAAGVRCVLQRAPETTWSAGGPSARARADVQQAMAQVAATLHLPPPDLHRD